MEFYINEQNEKRIKRKVESGRYDSANEVVSKALTLLDQLDEGHMETGVTAKLSDKHRAAATSKVSQEPLKVFEPDAIRQIGDYLPVIEEAINFGVAFGSQNNVPVDAVRVSRFVSQDDPSFSEIFLSFYSSADREKLIEFFPILSEYMGEWGNNQPENVRTTLTSNLAIEILPIDFWQHVRS